MPKDDLHVIGQPHDVLLDPYKTAYAVHLPALSRQRQKLLGDLKRRYIDQHGPEVAKKAHEWIFAAELLQWDRDRIALLKGLHRALSDAVPVPTFLANVLTDAIALYLSGRCKSMDEALGLSRPGKPPRLIAKQSHELRAALGRMFALQLVGATVPQAALLVSRLSAEFTQTTLEDRYRRGGYSDRMKATRALGPLGIDPAAVLADYPNTPREVAKAKASIRSMYAKAQRLKA